MHSSRCVQHTKEGERERGLHSPLSQVRAAPKTRYRQRVIHRGPSRCLAQGGGRQRQSTAASSPCKQVVSTSLNAHLSSLSSSICVCLCMCAQTRDVKAAAGQCRDWSALLAAITPPSPRPTAKGSEAPGTSISHCLCLWQPRKERNSHQPLICMQIMFTYVCMRVCVCMTDRQPHSTMDTHSSNRTHKGEPVTVEAQDDNHSHKHTETVLPERVHASV